MKKKICDFKKNWCDSIKEIIATFFFIIFIAFLPLILSYWSEHSIGYNINYIYYLSESLLTIFVISINTIFCIYKFSRNQKTASINVCFYILVVGAFASIWFYRDFQPIKEFSERRRTQFDLLSIIWVGLFILLTNLIANFLLERKNILKKELHDKDLEIQKYKLAIKNIQEILNKNENENATVRKINKIMEGENFQYEK